MGGVLVVNYGLNCYLYPSKLQNFGCGVVFYLNNPLELVKYTHEDI
jgi:hypothetical protein